MKKTIVNSVVVSISFMIFVTAAIAQEKSAESTNQNASALEEVSATDNKIDTAKIQDIRKLMRITGSGDMGKQMIGSMISEFKKTNPNIPDEFWQEFMSEFDTGKLVELNIPIYDKYLSHDEIKGIIAFYESPIGKKFIEAIPQIMNDSYQAGRLFGDEVGQKVIQKLIDGGYLDPETIGR